MAIGNAIRLMCRASKSRIGDHFQAAIGLAILVVYFRNRGSIAVEDINLMKG